jgi:hypothetical protein
MTAEVLTLFPVFHCRLQPLIKPFRFESSSLTRFRFHWNDNHGRMQRFAPSSPVITLLDPKRDGSTTHPRKLKQKSKV